MAILEQNPNSTSIYIGWYGECASNCLPFDLTNSEVRSKLLKVFQCKSINDGFNGFDATVQAGGYNSFHETRQSNLPALFYPNMSTGMDDQLARCNIAAEEGWGFVVVERNRKSIAEGVSKLLQKTRMKSSDFERSGAWELAEKLVKRS